ncbi:uncharacterized protein LOC129571471 [Sitodiplosis mosellana]|uniref:uncharacterized protein LOC129571471 n=1 Tax=Sitodiplosis mosellana TaxID=263140 RepID=UPI002443BDBC|nr:uncharacterized protein LOC129571471 [Sitodiplosis mosellana]
MEKNRVQNFSEEETNHFFDLVSDHIPHLDGIGEKKPTNIQKTSVWEKIANELAARTGLKRKASSLKDKWKKAKSATKMYYSREKNQAKRTGGGLPDNIEKPRYYDRVLPIVQMAGTVALEGIPPVPSDSDFDIASIENFEYSETEQLIEEEIEDDNNTTFSTGNLGNNIAIEESVITDDPLAVQSRREIHVKKTLYSRYLTARSTDTLNEQKSELLQAK